MSIVKLDLSDDLTAFVDRQVAEHGYKSAADYLSDLVSKQRDLEILRGKLLKGANSGPGPEADGVWFAELKQQAER